MKKRLKGVSQYYTYLFPIFRKILPKLLTPRNVVFMLAIPVLIGISTFLINSINESRLAQKEIELRLSKMDTEEKKRKHNFNNSIEKAHHDYKNKNYYSAYKNYDNALQYGVLKTNDKKIFTELIERKAIEYLQNGYVDKAKIEIDKFNDLTLRSQVDNQDFNLNNLLNNEKYIQIIKNDTEIIGINSQGQVDVIKKSINGEIFEFNDIVESHCKINFFSGEWRYIPTDSAKIKNNKEIKIDFPNDELMQKEMFGEFFLAQECADFDAKKAYPYLKTSSIKLEYQRVLYDKYILEILRRYSISTPILTYMKLLLKGFKNSWDANDIDKSYCGSPSRDRFKE